MPGLGANMEGYAGRLARLFQVGGMEQEISAWEQGAPSKNLIAALR